MGNPLDVSYIPKQQDVGNEKSSTPILHFEDPNFSVFARQRSRKNNHGSLKLHSGYFRSETTTQPNMLGPITAVNINSPLIWITTTVGEFVVASVSL